MFVKRIAPILLFLKECTDLKATARLTNYFDNYFSPGSRIGLAHPTQPESNPNVSFELPPQGPEWFVTCSVVPLAEHCVIKYSS